MRNLIWFFLWTFPWKFPSFELMMSGLEEGEGMEVDGDQGGSASPLDESGILDAPKPGITSCIQF